MPNGRGPGGPVNRAGIRISGTAYGNFIGPATSSAATSATASHSTRARCCCRTSSRAISSAWAPRRRRRRQRGDGHRGRHVPEARAERRTRPAISAIIGPANTISDNKGAAPSLDLDVDEQRQLGRHLDRHVGDEHARIRERRSASRRSPRARRRSASCNFGNAGNGITSIGRNTRSADNLILAQRAPRHRAAHGSADNNKIIAATTSACRCRPGFAARRARQHRRRHPRLRREQQRDRRPRPDRRQRDRRQRPPRHRDARWLEHVVEPGHAQPDLRQCAGRHGHRRSTSSIR